MLCTSSGHLHCVVCRRIHSILSQAVDPWGKVIADAGEYPTTDETEALNGQPNAPSSQIDTPSIVTVEIDLSMIDSIRQRMPIDLHRSNAKF